MDLKIGQKIFSVITGSGSYIPTCVVPNAYFLDQPFYGPDGIRLDKSNEEIISKFENITGIKERRYITDELVTSDIAHFAAKAAIEKLNNSEISGRTIIVNEARPLEPRAPRRDFNSGR